MYYIYFIFILILSGMMLVETVQKNHPRWWAAAVFLAPVTTPYFIFKSRKESGLTLFIVFLVTFATVTGVEFFLYSNYMEKNKYSDMPIVTRQMIEFSNQLKLSTLELDRALAKLEKLSKVESRINEIKKTIEFIDQLRGIIKENQTAVYHLVRHVTDYRRFFNKKELSWVFNVQNFYQNRNVTQHYKSLQKYLDAFENLLKYTYVNFYNITELKSEKHFKNYDDYYLKYRRAVDAHNRFNVKRIEFQNEFIKKYPDTKPYLPGERHTEALKLWE